MNPANSLSKKLSWKNRAFRSDSLFISSKSSPISRLGALCVVQPAEMRSTPHGHDAGFVLNHGNQHGNQIGMGNIIGYNFRRSHSGLGPENMFRAGKSARAYLFGIGFGSLRHLRRQMRKTLDETRREILKQAQHVIRNQNLPVAGG